MNIRRSVQVKPRHLLPLASRCFYGYCLWLSCAPAAAQPVQDRPFSSVPEPMSAAERHALVQNLKREGLLRPVTITLDGIDVQQFARIVMFPEASSPGIAATRPVSRDMTMSPATALDSVLGNPVAVTNSVTASRPVAATNPVPPLSLPLFTAPSQLPIAEQAVSAATSLSPMSSELRPELQLMLAQNYHELGDIRAVPVLEKYLAAVKASKDLGSDSKANLSVEAARLLFQWGEHDKAQSVYEQIDQYGYGWGSGLSLLFRAQNLMRKGNYEQAQILLKTPVTGQWADQIQVVLSSELGTSYYESGELKLAEEWYEKAVNEYEALKSPLHGEGLSQFYGTAKDGLAMIEQWKKQPLVCQPDALYRAIWSDDKEVEGISWRLFARSYFPLPIEVSADNPALKVRLVEVDEPRRRFNSSQEVIVEVGARDLLTSLDANVTIRGKNDPHFSLKIPVFIEVR